MAFGDLTTLAAVKAWLQTGQSAFPDTDDTLLCRLITAASQFIQTWLGRQIASGDWQEIRDGTGGQRFRFACIPVTAVLSLTIDGLAIPPAPPPGAPNGGGYDAGYVFTRRLQNVIVTYTAGYPATPPDVVQACIELVCQRYRERTHIGEVARALSGAEIVTYSERDMSPDVGLLLSQYRLVAPVTALMPQPAPTATDPATLVAAL